MIQQLDQWCRQIAIVCVCVCGCLHAILSAYVQHWSFQVLFVTELFHFCFMSDLFSFCFLTGVFIFYCKTGPLLFCSWLSLSSSVHLFQFCSCDWSFPVLFMWLILSSSVHDSFLFCSWLSLSPFCSWMIFSISVHVTDPLQFFLSLILSFLFFSLTAPFRFGSWCVFHVAASVLSLRWSRNGLWGFRRPAKSCRKWWPLCNTLALLAWSDSTSASRFVSACMVGFWSWQWDCV